MKTNLLIRRIVSFPSTSWLALAVLFTGCKPDIGPADSLGFYQFQIDQVYERPSAGIRIDILHTCVGMGSPPGCEVIPPLDLTSTEKKLIVQALDSLSDADLIKSGLKFINPRPDPNYLSDKPTFTNGGLDIPVPDTFIPNRPSNLNIGNEVLTALGFPPAATPASSSATSTLSAAIVTPSSGGQTAITPLEARGINITSPKAPSSYVPMTSKEGMQEVNSEYNFSQTKDTNKLPTLRDLIRPHGDVQIVPTSNKNQ